MKLHAAPVGAVSGDEFLSAFCFSTDAVGDAVYIMGDKVGDTFQVTKVDINNIATVPAIGIILLKESSTSCIVQTAGIMVGIYTGRTPHKPQFIGLDAKLYETPPAEPTSGRRAVQIVAQALSTSDLLIHPKSPIIRVAS
jgi:hypothetical protein